MAFIDCSFLTNFAANRGRTSGPLITKMTKKLKPVKSKAGRKGSKTTAEKRKIANKVLSSYAEGGVDSDGNAVRYTFSSCCNAAGISFRTFYNWKDQDTTIAKALKTAQDLNAKRDLKDLTVRASQGLTWLSQGNFVTERSVFTEEIFDAQGNLKGKKIRAEDHVRFVKPNPAACIFIKKNADPEYFNDLDKTESTAEEQVFKINGQTIKF